MKKALFWISIALNIILILGIFWNNFNSPSNELGILKQDIEVGFFMGNETVFTLPKGLTVKDKSERGIAAIGQFENNRFYIVITSDKDIVDYNVDEKEINQNGNYYSAEFKTYLNEE
ncbi:hypothetical protein KO500_00045 [Cellulophaga baltica]|uniref:hypothetical protein n=1 Tax=Cellulophaga TaxID=104264 RepID=UPI001C079645|nr:MULTISPECIES: hypothetical protein [Cellulophaga]MBU2994804.1 hypothetical protein [Cellulophaga baltica]MDO6766199.1 hypothetical protein [Cellulophaga sp. 1_MG-2023]